MYGFTVIPTPVTRPVTKPTRMAKAQTVAAMKAPAVSEAFKKQTFNIVPSASLADAKTWLGQQMDTWRKITSEVKIETE